MMKVEIDDASNITEGWCAPGQEAKPFEDAVISWGGTVAEYLTGHIWRHGPPVNLFPLNEKCLTRWHDEVLFHMQKMSTTDRHGILNSGCGNTLEACQYCFRVLSRRLSDLKDDAELLAARTRTERAAKLAAVREAKELSKRLESELRPVLINGKPQIPVSIAGRAKILADYLEGRPDDDPEKIRLAPMLDTLRRGENPALNGELETR